MTDFMDVLFDLHDSIGESIESLYEIVEDREILEDQVSMDYGEGTEVVEFWGKYLTEVLKSLLEVQDLLESKISFD